MTLAGKRVLITGGGTGVGADLARGFAGAGAAVTVAGRREAPLRAVAGPLGATWVVADVTVEADTERMFANPYDIVIANAGAAESALVARTTLDQWNALLAVNLTGTFLTFRAAARSCAPGSRLIAIASTAALRGAPYIGAYAAAKHGVLGLVRSLALELASVGTTVNAICPGFLDTEMSERSVAMIAQKTGRSLTDARKVLEADSPQHRLYAPEEVTATALWLASDAARGVSGQAIAISGGTA